MSDLPAHVEVVVEVPRGGRVKRRADGRLDFVSPVPCPFNYGAIPAIAGDDGPLDAILLGPSLPRGHRATLPVRGIVRFVDGGASDDKVVCGRGPSERELRRMLVFFEVYAVFKRALYRVRGERRGRTALIGWEPLAPRGS